MAKMCCLGSNNKMTMTIRETVDYLRALDFLTAQLPRESLRLFFIPSFTALSAASACAGGIDLGAQNMCWEERGQFTGEVSPLMLREVGVSIVEIGHSERRHIFGETDEMANRKVLCALSHGFTPLLCVGETAEQRACGIADEILRIQLIRGLRGVSAADAGRLSRYGPSARAERPQPRTMPGRSTRFFDKPSAPCSDPPARKSLCCTVAASIWKTAGRWPCCRRSTGCLSAGAPGSLRGFTVLSKRSCRSLK